MGLFLTGCGEAGLQTGQSGSEPAVNADVFPEPIAPEEIETLPRQTQFPAEYDEPTGNGETAEKSGTTGNSETAENGGTAGYGEMPENGEYANSRIDPEGSYTSAEDVALYLYTYDELPDNFITKDEANDLGWSGGSLEPYAPGMCIGGDYFGNYEGILPDGKYHECDIDTLGAKSRGAKRLVYSDDGRIYYTEDHYETFTLIYGEE